MSENALLAGTRRARDSPARADRLPILAVAELLAAAIVLAAHVLGEAEAWDADAAKLQQADHWSDQWRHPAGQEVCSVCSAPAPCNMLLSTAAKVQQAAQAGT